MADLTICKFGCSSIDGCTGECEHAEQVSAMRKQQPLDELKRKAKKSERLKGKIWTQEQTDLIIAESTAILVKMAPPERA